MTSSSRVPSAALLGSLAALGATIVWSGNFVIARGVSDAIAPATLAFLRWSVACLALAPFAFQSVVRDLPLIRKHLNYLLPASFLGVTIFNTLIYVAGHHTTALNLSLIATFIPAFILLLSRIFLGEHFTPARLAGLVISVSGIIFLLTGGHLEILLDLTFNQGDLIMLGAAFIFAAYSIMVRRKPKEISQLTMLGATFSLGLLMLLPWLLLEQMPFSPFKVPATLFTPEVLGGVLYIGVGASLVSYSLWNIALERIGPTRAGFIYYSTPLFAGLQAALLLGEPVTLIHAASGGLIIGGIFLATKYGNPTKDK